MQVAHVRRDERGIHIGAQGAAVRHLILVHDINGYATSICIHACACTFAASAWLLKQPFTCFLFAAECHNIHTHNFIPRIPALLVALS
jgi:hypothetical protein